jgi:hypothetical protein
MLLETSNEKINDPKELAGFINTAHIVKTAGRLENPTLDFFIQGIKDQMDAAGVVATEEAIEELAKRLMEEHIANRD